MINPDKERLELIEKIKSKIQEEIDSNINHYKSYLRENVITNLLFKQICFNVTAISNLENFINLPYAFLEIYESNLYRLEKGMISVSLENYYDSQCPTVTVKLDPAKTPTQNAQKYYKDYRKAQTAENILKEQT